MQNLSTTEKNSLVGSINELKQGLDDKASTSALTEGLSGKQGTINDLDTIRSGAGKGATSVQGVKMEGDDEPLSPDGNGVVTIPQPEIPDSVTSVITNNELVFQTPDGQSVKGKVGITTGADGLLHLSLTDEEGNTYSSPIAGLRVDGNALQYSNDGETWTTVQTFGKLAIKYVQASDPASGDEGDLALVGTTNAYVLKVYAGGSWVSVGDIGTLDLTSDGIMMAGENKTLTGKLEEIPEVGNSVDDSELNVCDENGYVVLRLNGGHIKTKNFDSSYLSVRPLKGKTVAFLGDSITAGSGTSVTSKRYSTVFSQMEGCTEVNLGIAGTCLAANTTNGLGGSRFITRATAQNLGSVDFIFVFGGTNDFTYDSQAIGDSFVFSDIASSDRIGNQKKTPNADNKSFAGALHELILQIRSVAPNAQVVFITPLNRGRYASGRPTSAERNVNGDYLQDFRKTIVEICDFYAIPVIQLHTLFNQDWTNDVATSSLSSYSDDGIHPNDNGHKRIAEVLYKWVESNIII